jgi:DNA gyrase/topoisomerase IV subunit B
MKKTAKITRVASVDPIVDARTYYSSNSHVRGVMALVSTGKNSDGQSCYFVEVFERRGGTHVTELTKAKAVASARCIAREMLAAAEKVASAADVLRMIADRVES